jgi:hypothetical protein
MASVSQLFINSNGILVFSFVVGLNYISRYRIVSWNKNPWAYSSKKKIKII